MAEENDFQTPADSPTGLPASAGSVIGTDGICWAQSDGKLGWAIRRIERASNDSVTLNDGVSFCSPCFAGAVEGDIWAVCHESGGACFGQVRRAILLEPARRVYSQNKEIADASPPLG